MYYPYLAVCFESMWVKSVISIATYTVIHIYPAGSNTFVRKLMIPVSNELSIAVSSQSSDCAFPPIKFVEVFIVAKFCRGCWICGNQINPCGSAGVDANVFERKLTTVYYRTKIWERTYIPPDNHINVHARTSPSPYKRIHYAGWPCNHQNIILHVFRAKRGKAAWLVLC